MIHQLHRTPFGSVWGTSTLVLSLNSIFDIRGWSGVVWSVRAFEDVQIVGEIWLHIELKRVGLNFTFRQALWSSKGASHSRACPSTDSTSSSQASSGNQISLSRNLVEAAGVEPAPTSNIIYYFNILILYRTTGEQPFLFFNQFHHNGNNKIIVILKVVTR